MVQNILNAMDSDSVVSIDDTVESLQVAELLREAYFHICAQRDWPFLRTLTSLTGLGDTANPTTMRIPDSLNKIIWLKYNKKDVCYLDPLDFKTLIDKREVVASVVNSNGFIINRDPSYWTTYDDRDVVFDSIDLAANSTLVAAKSAAYAVSAPVWTMVDSFIPLMPDKMFPTLLAEAKSASFINLKQQANSKEESKARNGLIRAQNEVWRVKAGETGNFGKHNFGRS